MSQSDKPKRPLGLGGYAATMGVTIVVALLAGIGSAAFGRQPGIAGLVVTGVFISVATAVGFAACLWWWRGIDEAAREAHKWAWWWGGSAGMAVGAVVFLTLSWRDEDQPLPGLIGSDPTDLFVSGMTALAVFQLAGYSLAWAGWWLKHR